MSRWRLAALGLLILLANVGTRAQQPRDNQAPTATGQGRITGVVTDAKEGSPLRRARVSLSGSELTRSRMGITADDGTFAFDGLPAGRYSLSASKDGYVTMNYGAARRGRPGRVLTLTTTGASIRADLRLPIGSVITGTVLNADGEPAVGVTVNAYTSQYDGARGERRFSIPPTGVATTDDRGIYRVFGLAEGTYVIAAIPRLPGNTDVQVLTQAEIRSALAEVRQAQVSTRPGMPAPPASNGGVAEGRRGVTLTHIFYPGTSLSDRATPLTLRAGEVRNGVNIDLEYVPTATIEGTVTVPPGMRVQLYITNSDPMVPGPGMRVAVPSDEGRFAFRSIPPGTYSISARAYPFNVRSGAQPVEIGMWGETPVVVAGEDITGIALALHPPVTISGRVIFEGNGPRVPDLFSMRLQIPALPAGISNPVGLPGAVFDGSRFSISGVLPGQYRFTSPPRGIRAPIGPWWMKSLILHGREMLDAPLELRESTDEGVVTFSDKASELTGAVRDVNGAAVTDGFVVVFSAEPRLWFHQSRRVAGVRPSAAGTYVVRNLPAGEYLVAVTSEIDLNEWFDPEVLKVLARSAARVSIKDNETRTLDLSSPR